MGKEQRKQRPECSFALSDNDAVAIFEVKINPNYIYYPFNGGIKSLRATLPDEIFY
jgi:hypothetical protein